MPDKPNVLLLTVDALRADRTSVLGYDRPTTPNLERMSRDALVCETAVSPAAFTHICFPSLMTSSRPLSHGGYDTGPAGRPPTLFQAFHHAGYETTAYCTTHWVSRAQGYREGIDNEYLLFVLNALPGLAMALCRSTLAAWHRREVDDEVAVAQVWPVLRQFFDSVETYADVRIAGAADDRRHFPDARLVRDGYDFPKVIALARRHRAEFERDPLSYMRTRLDYVPKAHQWIASEWRYYRRPSAMLRLGFERLADLLFDSLAPGRMGSRHRRIKRYVDGADVTARIVRTIAEWDGRKPFFIWNHFQDTHIPYCAGYGATWYRQTPDYLRALGYGPDVNVATALGGAPRTEKEWRDWSALYDAAIRFTDEQVGRIVDALETRGIAEDTIVAVTGDHGEELGEHGDISHHFRLYSHNVRVPMMFYRKGLTGRRLAGLTDLLDLAPTLADLAGIADPTGWQGLPVTDPAVGNRDHLLLETFHGGNCLFDKRAVYMAVRSDRFNFLWKEFRDPEDTFSPDGPELFDFLADPDEQTNLYHPDHPVVRAFEDTIVRRLREIPEISEERVTRAFPHHAPAARATTP